MQTATTNNLVLTDASSFKLLADLPVVPRQGEFYQHMTQELIRGVYTKRALHNLGDRLVALAHYSYTLRRMDDLDHVCQTLITLPFPREYWSVGCFYQGLSLKRQGRFAEARLLFERVAGEVPHWYRGRVLMSLAGLVFDSGDYDSALSFYVEAGRAAFHDYRQDWFIAAHTQKMIAVLKSIDGDRRGALVDLERLFPLVGTARSAHPSLYYDYMNSLAVELCGVGRLEEAKNVSQIVLASPFAAAYPEWRETREEIELRGWRASRSTVAQTQAGAVSQSGAESRNAAESSDHAGQRGVVPDAALATTASEARNRPHDDDSVGNAGTATTEVVSETSNIFTRLGGGAASSRQNAQPHRGRLRALSSFHRGHHQCRTRMTKNSMQIRNEDSSRTGCTECSWTLLKAKT